MSLAQVRTATDAVAAAAAAGESAVADRDQAIRDAVAAGARVTDVATASGLSRERVYQILRA